MAFANPEYRLAPEAPDVKDEYQRQRGRKLVCTAFAEKLQLCYRYEDGKKLPYVTQKDIKKWKIGVEQIHAKAKQKAFSQVQDSRFRFEKISNMSSGYWISDKKDGWDAAALLHPKRLRQLLGRKALVAIPQAGTFIFWEAGNPMLNKIMAVGIREIYDNSNHPVSSSIYHHKDGKWIVWGEAVVAPENK